MATEEQGKQFQEDALRNIVASAGRAHVGLHGIDPAPDNLSADEIRNRLSQLPPSALPGVETYLTGKLEAAIDREANLPSVPLTIYVDDQRFIVGSAVITGKMVHAKITAEERSDLLMLINAGLVKGLSVSFQMHEPAAPADPELPFEKAKEERSYNFDPTPPIRTIREGQLGPLEIIANSPFDKFVLTEDWRQEREKFQNKLPPIEGLKPDHTIDDEEPWQDKFPYGPK